ncbi:hypothetical protein PHYSODRAFT_327211 [Phytophthora sojae]|uniref:Pyruvate kinase n=1 Tax=Phytophthora sojae (strain P6497) TaxID=1094619 RepID=G4YZR8_PHYSP|nr:hypothetical protein PHYSODRAFT_327211 [Phytophthora sojae]EGZ26293.1 hypothetical protein PHYSODRAFT_327211 [Phytophthora sojae]|eukprot:XP_009521581.1 hypothetical protein PHYSODRAFT_327211 [Phytophthora sojae]
MPALSEQDKRGMNWAVEHVIDFIAASVIRNTSDVHDKPWLHEPNDIAPKFTATVENPEGVRSFEETLDARLAYYNMTVDHCNAVGKPVDVGKQKLESTENNPRPTRADCVESAPGKYPIESVTTMNIVVKDDKLLLQL